MAISDNRVTYDTIKSLTKLTFDNTSDVAKTKAGTSTVAGSTNTMTTSVFKPKKKISIPSSDIAIGNLDPAIVSASASIDLPKEYKLSRDKINTERNLGSGSLSNILGNLSDTDKLLSSAGIPKIDTNALSEFSDARIDSMIDGLGKTAVGSEFKKYVDPSKFKSLVKGKLSGANNVLGNTLKSKLNIGQLSKPCANLNYDLNYNLSGLFGLSFLSGLFDSIGCMGPEAIMSFIQNIMKLDNINGPSILAGLAESVKKDVDTLAIDKLLIMKSINDVVPGIDSKAATKGISAYLTRAVGDTEPKTNSMVSEYTNINDSFDALDPDWDLDDNGDMDLSFLKGNKRMSALANNYTKSQVKPSVFSGTETTVLSRNDNISIMDSFTF